jgi:hypothetical protein
LLSFLNSIVFSAFSQVLVSPSARFGYHNLMTTSGLGAMTPNTVVLPLFHPEERDTACASLAEYVNVMRDAVMLGKNVVVASGFDNLPDISKGEEKKEKKGCFSFCFVFAVFEPASFSVMDLFLLPHERVATWEEFSLGPLGSLTLMWGLMSRRLAMRLVRIAAIAEREVQEERERLVDIVKRKGRFRVGKKGRAIEVVAVQQDKLPPLDSVEYFQHCSELISMHRAPNSTILFAAMPNVSAEPDVWLACARALVHNQGPTLLVLTSRDQQLMTVQI